MVIVSKGAQPKHGDVTAHLNSPKRRETTNNPSPATKRESEHRMSKKVTLAVLSKV